jgi:hypothetical protein
MQESIVRDLGGGPLTPEQAAIFQPDDAKRYRNWLSLVLIAGWLLHDHWFRERQRFSAPAFRFLAEGLNEHAQFIQAPRFVLHADRREELARLCLRALGLRPGGEAVEQAEDRLMTLDSMERQRVIRATQAAEERARAIREAMARKSAQEGADKVLRE